MVLKYKELDLSELMSMDPDEVALEYQRLLGHHIEETTALLHRIPKKGPSIIVVGPDGVGKTTVVRNLSRLTGIRDFKCPSEKQIFKHGGRSSLAFDYMMTHFLEQTRFRFISDRGYPCEWVYSKVFGRDTDGPLLELIDKGHECIGTKILYLYSSSQPIEEDDIVPADKYWAVKETYDKFCEWTSCRVVALDTAPMLATYQRGEDSSEAFTKFCMEKLGDIF